jgi:hypothetical protein
MPNTPAGSSRFTVEDERLMAGVAERLRGVGLAVERASQPGVDCYRIVPVGSDDPAWLVMRQYDGVYQLLSGGLRVLDESRRLRAVLPAGWLAASPADGRAFNR